MPRLRRDRVSISSMLHDAPNYSLFYPQHDRSYIGNDVFDVNVFVLHSKLAPLYAQSPREIQRCSFLKALINQYGLWVGLGKRSMTMIDYGCGFGALSQVSSLIPLPSFIIFKAQTNLNVIYYFAWWYCMVFLYLHCVWLLC